MIQCHLMQFYHILQFKQFQSYIHALSPSLAKGKITKTIVVDPNGGGNFKSVQEAVNSVPWGNNQWIKIRIRSGYYMEKVIVPQGKGYLVFEGDGRKSTVISWEDYESIYNHKNHNYSHHHRRFHNNSHFHILDLHDSATFAVWAENVVLKNIGFKNSYGGGQYKGKAVAVTLGADKIAAYRCSFMGIQDTLCDLYYRHYFKGCYIEGAFDFIWGYGQSLYENCKIQIVGALPNAVGWVTAHGRYQDDSTAFVFKDCIVKGKANTYLGRAWGPKARVIFYRTNMSSIVVPEGWDNNHFDTSLITFAENENSGPGANIHQRVKWMKRINGPELYSFVDKSFVDDGWVHQQP